MGKIEHFVDFLVFLGIFWFTLLFLVISIVECNNFFKFLFQWFHDYFPVVNHQIYESVPFLQMLQHFKLDDSHDATHEANIHKNKKNPSYSEFSSLVTDKSSLVCSQVDSYLYHISRLPLFYVYLIR